MANALLFANNAATTLAGAITNTALTANLSPGSGAEFPAPSAGQYFIATFTDQATGLLTEIVKVTNVTGDTITMVRAQEGTTALAWSAGDIFANLWTAGQAATMVQNAALQKQAGNYAIDSGTTNAYVVTLNPVITTRQTGMPIRVKAASTNTGAATLNYSGTAVAIQWRGAALTGGEIASGVVFEVIDDGTVLELQQSQITKVAGTALTAVTGSGAVMLSASPTTTGTMTAQGADFSGTLTVDNGSGTGLILSGGSIVSGGLTSSLTIGGSGSVDLSVSTVGIAPIVDAAQSNGTSNRRWTTVWATNGTINTSDVNEKTPFRKPTKKETIAAKAILSLPGFFQWKDAVELKGEDGARWHFGFGAQHVMKALSDAGLDPFDYAFLCRDDLYVLEDETRVVSRPKFNEVDSIELVADVLDGKRIYRQTIVKRQEPVMEYCPVYDVDGKPILHDDKPVMAAQQAMEDVSIVLPQNKKVMTGKDRYGLRYDQVILFALWATTQAE